jgi:hypothetical protein
MCFEIESKPEAFPWLECVQDVQCYEYTEQEIQNIKELLSAKEADIEARRIQQLESQKSVQMIARKTVQID